MPPPDLHRYRPGERPAATDLDATNQAVLRQGRWTADRGLTLQDGPTGRQLARTGTDRLPLLLSGTASPYTGVPAQRVGGVWQAIPGAPTFPIVLELNDTAGLEGEVHEAFPVGVTAAGEVEYAVQATRFGEPCVGAIVGSAWACRWPNQALVGQAVTLRQGGSTLATATTGSTGGYSFAGLPAGDYTVEVTRTRFAPAAVPVHVGCATSTVTVKLVPAAGFVCCPNCDDPFPDTLVLTNEVATIPLVWTVDSAAMFAATGTHRAGWEGSHGYTRAGYSLDAYGHCVPATVTGPVWWYLSCTWELTQLYRFCGGLDISNTSPSRDAAHFTAASGPRVGWCYSPASVPHSCADPALAFDFTKTPITHDYNAFGGDRVLIGGTVTVST